MVDFNEWSQDPFALFAAFLTLVITVTFISGIIFLFGKKKAVNPKTNCFVCIDII